MTPTAAMLFALTVLASPPSTTGAEFPLDKKSSYLSAKAANAADGDANARPERGPMRAHAPIFARNLRTRELAILEGPGALDDAARHDYFRCWFTGKRSEIDGTLAEVLVETALHFERREVRIVSGFRHPKYNLMLRKKGREVAAKSRHTRSQAIDFFIPGVTTKPLYRWLLEHHRGGVGYYPVSEFVHVDFGPKRTWQGT